MHSIMSIIGIYWYSAIQYHSQHHHHHQQTSCTLWILQTLVIWRLAFGAHRADESFPLWLPVRFFFIYLFSCYLSHTRFQLVCPASAEEAAELQRRDASLPPPPPFVFNQQPSAATVSCFLSHECMLAICSSLLLARCFSVRNGNNNNRKQLLTQRTSSLWLNGPMVSRLGQNRAEQTESAVALRRAWRHKGHVEVRLKERHRLSETAATESDVKFLFSLPEDFFFCLPKTSLQKKINK